jgi:protein-disulfide isomerase
MRLFAAILLSCGLLAAQDFPVGSKISAIKVVDQGAPVVLNPSAAKATAIIFVSVQCPVSNAYNERMSALYRDYSNRGIQFAFVNANATEPPDVVASHAREKGFPFKVYKDADNILADKFGAQVTPEVFLFDNAGTLVYHGRIDDSQVQANIKTNDARSAFDAVLAGKPVTVTTTKAFGCTIRRARKAS